MKTVLITGAGQRLGKNIAELLVKNGYAVILHYHTSKKQTLALAKKIGAKTLYADFRKKNSISKMFEKIPEVDMVINTVGSFIYQPLFQTSVEQFETCIENNLFFAYALTSSAIPLFQKKNFGRIIHFGSVGCDQITARPLTTPYYIAKTGLFMLTKSFAQELKNTGITINMVTPGILPTGVKPAKKAPTIPFDDVANVVLFLVSEENKHINGANIEVAGGWRPE